MVKISKFTNNAPTQYTEGTVVVNFIDMVNEVITYKKIMDDSVLFAFKINLSDIYSRSDFSEQTFWGVDARAIDEFKKLQSSSDEQVFYTVESKYILNSLKISLPKKDNSLLLNSNSDAADMVFFLPYSTNTDEDIIFRVQDNPNFTSIESDSEIVEVSHVSWKNIISPIQLVSSEETDDMVTVTVSTDPKLSKLYIEQVSGLINKTVISLVNGQGTFSVLKLGLESGDVVSAKVGHKYYTGVLNFSTTI